MTARLRRALAITSASALMLVVPACGSSGEAPAEGEATTSARAGIRLVSADEANDIRLAPPDDLVILDVRTPEEFADAHVEGATMLDFYRADFAAALAELDRDRPYVLYCRSGNRSGQTATLMADLGFTDVAEVDGGILAWQQAGLPLD